jgi:hypothetical protein
MARACAWGSRSSKPLSISAPGGDPAFRAVTISATFPGVSLVSTTSLIIAAGAWSHMPMHGVHSSEKAPSALVWPTAMPRPASNAA